MRWCWFVFLCIPLYMYIHMGNAWLGLVSETEYVAFTCWLCLLHNKLKVQLYAYQYRTSPTYFVYFIIVAGEQCEYLCLGVFKIMYICILQMWHQLENLRQQNRAHFAWKFWKSSVRDAVDWQDQIVFKQSKLIFYYIRIAIFYTIKER